MLRLACPPRTALRAFGVLCALAALPAAAMDKFEIQVYQGEHNDPGQFALELHTNYTASGHAAPAWPGETPPDRALRFTLEPAYGLTQWLEVGAYLQLMVSPDGGAQFGGWKLRTKLIAPEAWGLPLTLGINVEVGRVPLHVEEEGWANEFRPIIGWEHGRFSVTVNPIFGFALTGPDAFKPDFEPAAKAKLNTNLGFSLGVEYYAALGRFDQGFVAVKEQEHVLFAVLDLEPPAGTPADKAGPWELNLAVGKGLTLATPQQWLVKAIVGRAF